MLARIAKRLRRSGLVESALHLLGRLGLLKVAFSTYERLLALERGPGTSAGLVETDGLPLPPAHLRVLVAGTADADVFRQTGRSMFLAIDGLLRKRGARPEDMKAVLEFGCGCGRVLRYWQPVRGPEVHGADYSEPAVAWCRDHLPFARCATNGPEPPLAYPDGAFDLVYAVSVFTHLSQDRQAPWMAELRRIVRPGGHVLFTTHGADYMSRLTTGEREAFESGELVVRYEELSGRNLCSAFHPEAYVRRRLSEGFTVEEFVSSGRQDGVYQDLYLMRKHPDPPGP